MVKSTRETFLISPVCLTPDWNPGNQNHLSANNLAVLLLAYAETPHQTVEGLMKKDRAT